MTVTQASQQLMALAKANQRRAARSLTKASLKAAPNRNVAWRRLASVLEDPDDHLAGMPVAALIDACQWTGPSTTKRVLRHAGLTPTTTVAGMNSRQHEALLIVLRCGSIVATERKVA